MLTTCLFLQPLRDWFVIAIVSQSVVGSMLTGLLLVLCVENAFAYRVHITPYCLLAGLRAARFAASLRASFSFGPSRHLGKRFLSGSSLSTCFGSPSSSPSSTTPPSRSQTSSSLRLVDWRAARRVRAATTRRAYAPFAALAMDDEGDERRDYLLIVVAAFAALFCLSSAAVSNETRELEGAVANAVVSRAFQRANRHQVGGLQSLVALHTHAHILVTAAVCMTSTKLGRFDAQSPPFSANIRPNAA